MTILSDCAITALAESGKLGIFPFVTEHVQPASYDVHLAAEALALRAPEGTAVDTRDPEKTMRYLQVQSLEFLAPRTLYLGSTVEKIKLPAGIGARFEGKSSLGRLGLLTHVTAGYIDPGFDGTITVELYNLLDSPLLVRPGMPIGQLSFFYLDHEALNPYGSKNLGSHYNGQVGPTKSVGV